MWLPSGFVRNTISDWTSVPQPQACGRTFHHTLKMANSAPALQQPSHQHSHIRTAPPAHQWPCWMPQLQHSSSHLDSMLVIELWWSINHNACHRSYCIKNDTLRPSFYIPHIRSASRVYVTSAVTGCNSITNDSLEKILPLETFNCCDWSHSKSPTQYPYQAIVHSLRWTSSSI